MGDPDGTDANAGDDADRNGPPETDEDLKEEVRALREELGGVQGTVGGIESDLSAVETELEDRTVRREEIENDLKRYVRSRIRRGHARGWGPYLVLLYGTAMTIAAFAHLSGVWAILAMVVVWLSTLGLYVLMVLFGLAASALAVPGRAIEVIDWLADTLRNLRG